MLALERQKKIVEYVKEKKFATVAELAVYFHVHEATIRRDLSLLESEGKLRRTHGGVVIEEDKVKSEPSFQDRETVQFEEKRRIGMRAAQFIQDGENIILDSGTTTVHIAEAILDRKNITVITNDINVAAKLRFSNGIKVIVTGGTLYPESYMLNGLIADEVLGNLHVDKAFIGTPALHHKFGLTHFDEQIAATKRSMIKAAKSVYVVTDHTKVGRIALHTVASPNQIDAVIIGSELSEIEIKKWENSGVNLHLV
ncbi:MULTISPECIES: DeoR/GlpR family DNA-binding transcription regulator [Aeribacillus]|uniref:DeoR family transcriptional regulator n=1 Tax=Aeribacillus pallidus TaxID=33936 RepID=A0A163YK12_9BACI|nr:MULTISPECIES: DeoR/GlpR family DNA-binding transcription regulator [Aeribacillus]ASS89309.1 DeoR family transcriptional regulator [Aeribacillus pallidus]KZM53756.1 DeoR family transcriptional regulator [Aeribacillus pallidus]MED0650370.1 DeoR/GlpR family DNA-binding transcription regulator [Aeribacillus composti]MED0702206.1 DeoR/GlpR family DNA-binding transcription regulator [Aeribacillus composti]MED0717058.1 DeoR/GlpR family DNA-binding transcription regulator [Aeribacillus composti]